MPFTAETVVPFALRGSKRFFPDNAGQPGVELITSRDVRQSILSGIGMDISHVISGVPNSPEPQGNIRLAHVRRRWQSFRDHSPGYRVGITPGEAPRTWEAEADFYPNWLAREYAPILGSVGLTVADVAQISGVEIQLRALQDIQPDAVIFGHRLGSLGEPGELRMSDVAQTAYLECRSRGRIYPTPELVFDVSSQEPDEA